MIQYIIKTIFKNFRRNLLITTINVMGLTLSFTVGFIIIGHIQNQNKYDKNIKNSDRIYRLESHWASMPTFIGHALTQNLPDYKNCRLYFQEEAPVKYQSNEPILIEDIVFADSTFFEIFPVNLGNGDENKLKNRFQIYLSKKEAARIFQNDNPIGETVLIANQYEFQVAGVFDDLDYSHLQFGAVLSMVSLPEVLDRKNYLERLDGWECPTYILTPENTSQNEAEQTITKCLFEYDYKYFIKEFKLRKYSDIYFATNISNEAGTIHGNKKANKILLLIAIFIITLAIINYINLSTANAYRRYKWIGVNRIVGATKKRIIIQFLSETIVICLISLWFSMLLIEIINPYLSRMFSINILLPEIYSIKNSIYITLGIIVLGIFSGIYPAIMLSRYLPVYLIRKYKVVSSKRLKLRDILTVVQFVIAIVLITSTIFIHRQFTFISNRSLGFKSEHVITTRINQEIETNLEVFREKLLKHPEIKNLSYTMRIPGNEWGSWCCTRIDGKENKYFNQAADPNFLETFHIKLKEGRNFDWNKPSDFKKAFILNEVAVKEYDIDDPIGKYVDNTGNGLEGTIIGVVENFHFRGFHHKIDPVIIYWDNRYLRYANILVDGNQLDKSLLLIQEVWEDLYPAYPFKYTFLDDKFDQQYKSDKMFGRLVGIFSAIAFFIACIGILGFSFFYLNQQVKDIGIRKVHGADSYQIMKILVFHFLGRIFLAFLIAAPIIFYALKNWLRGYAYKIEITFWPFIFGGLITVILALSTVFWQTFKAARRNPVESLRYE